MELRPPVESAPPSHVITSQLSGLVGHLNAALCTTDGNSSTEMNTGEALEQKYCVQQRRKLLKMLENCKI